MSGGDKGPSDAQVAQQNESFQLAKRAEDRELARDRSLQVRIRARQNARRFGQFGRRSLAFNPGNKDLRTKPAGTDPGDPTAPGGKEGQTSLIVTKQQAKIRERNSRLYPKLFAKGEARRARKAERQGKTVAADTVPIEPAQKFRSVSA